MEYDEGTDSSVVAANRAMHRAALEAALTATAEGGSDTGSDTDAGAELSDPWRDDAEAEKLKRAARGEA